MKVILFSQYDLRPILALFLLMYFHYNFTRNRQCLCGIIITLALFNCATGEGPFKYPTFLFSEYSGTQIPIATITDNAND